MQLAGNAAGVLRSFEYEGLRDTREWPACNTTGPRLLSQHRPVMTTDIDTRKMEGGDGHCAKYWSSTVVKARLRWTRSSWRVGRSTCSKGSYNRWWAM